MNGEFYIKHPLALEIATGRSLPLDTWDDSLPLIPEHTHPQAASIEAPHKLPCVLFAEGDLRFEQTTKRRIRAVDHRDQVVWEEEYPKNKRLMRRFYGTEAGILKLDSHGFVELRRLADGKVKWTWDCAHQWAGLGPSKRDFAIVWFHGTQVWLGINLGGYENPLVCIDLSSGKVLYEQIFDSLFFGASQNAAGKLQVATSAQHVTLDLNQAKVTPNVMHYGMSTTYSIGSNLLSFGIGIVYFFTEDLTRTIWRHVPERPNAFERRIHSDGNGALEYYVDFENIRVNNEMVAFDFCERALNTSYLK